MADRTPDLASEPVWLVPPEKQICIPLPADFSLEEADALLSWAFM